MNKLRLENALAKLDEAEKRKADARGQFKEARREVELAIDDCEAEEAAKEQPPKLGPTHLGFDVTPVVDAAGQVH